ncbi:MAG TPA: sigma-70 family RNA polymerase sigma factor [Terracidiphilus sp.]|nr:sigma-70 family RNA polymerase sigma factor [Terracidiphilus sp.]
MASTTFPDCAGSDPVTMATDPLALEEKMETFLQTAEQRRGQLLHMARRITNRSEDSEDILQEAFLKACQALPKFRGDSQMSTWLNAIVRNTALEYLRSRKGRLFLPIEPVGTDSSSAPGMDFPDNRDTPEQCCERKEMETILHTEMGKLSTGCRRALELCFLEGCSQITAARLLNVRTETVKSRVFRGKRILHRMVSRKSVLQGSS